MAKDANAASASASFAYACACLFIYLMFMTEAKLSYCKANRTTNFCQDVAVGSLKPEQKETPQKWGVFEFELTVALHSFAFP